MLLTHFFNFLLHIFLESSLGEKRDLGKRFGRMVENSEPFLMLGYPKNQCNKSAYLFSFRKQVRFSEADAGPLQNLR